MKPPKNYYNSLDRMKQDLDTSTLPDVTTSDAGKVLKVSEAGGWELADDENTIIEANPDEQPTVDLENLKIGDTVYSVKNPELTSIKSFKLTMSNGGQYNTNKPIIEFFNEGGQEASITSSDYTVECDKTYAGNANMDQVCSISTPDTPGTFTYTFVNDFDIEEYSIMKLTRGGTFLTDIAKNIKLELSADGENYITIYDETTITWSDAVPYHLINLKDGSEASTLLPIVTSADNGKVLGVVGGVWDKMGVPTELPAVTGSDNGKVLSVSNGSWNKNTLPKVTIIPCTVISGANMITISRYNIGNIKDIITNTSVFDMVMLHNINSPYEYFYCNGYETDGTNTYASFIRVTRGATSTTYEKALFDITSTSSNSGTYSATTVNDPT